MEKDPESIQPATTDGTGSPRPDLSLAATDSAAQSC